MQLDQSMHVLSSLFVQHLGKGFVTTSVSIALALILTRCAPRIPGAVRSVLWLVVLAKCIVTTACSFTVAVPVVEAARPVIEQVRVYTVHPLTTVPLNHIHLGPQHSQAISTGGSATRAIVHTAAAPYFLNLQMCLMLFWAACVVIITIGRTLAFLKIARSVKLSPRYEGIEAKQDLAKLVRSLGLSRPPLLFLSSTTRTPFACGIGRPAIVLPASAETLSREDLRMTLAHELAHIKRKDPLLGLIPELARTLFFFNPLVHLAVHEYTVAREEACDRIALSLTASNPRTYAELLLRHVNKLRWNFSPPTITAMSSAHRAMRRRLLSLKNSVSSQSPRRIMAIQACLPFMAIPWQATMRVIPAAVTPSLPNIPIITSYIPILMSGSGLNVTNATSINAAGDVVGVAKTRAVLWQNNVLMSLDNGNRYKISVPSGISDSGMIVGSQYNNPEKLHGFAWTPVSHSLPAVDGFRYIEPVAVNGAGDIVGDARSGTRDRFGAVNSHAFLMRNGQMTDLGTLGGQHSCALGINGSDIVVGKSDVDRGIIGSIASTAPQTHAFVWSSGQMKDLGTLGGLNSLAYAVSNSGMIVGYSDTIYGTTHAFLYQSGSMRDLDALDGDDTSVAMCVNDRGQAVGYSGNQQVDNSQKAVLWTNGTIVDLNTMLPKNSGWVLQSAHAINDKGQIVGRGIYHGRKSGFLLVPSAI